MGWIDRLRRWLQQSPARSSPRVYQRTAQDDEEDEEIAELIAIDII